MLIAAVAFAAYAAISSLVSIAVGLVWRFRRLDRTTASAAARARKLALLRLSPAIAAIVLSLGVVLPAFAMFEPVRASETVGPLLLALAGCGMAVLATTLLVAARTALATYRLERAWLRGATALTVDPPAGVPAYVIDSLAPIVALVGVFSPRLVAARSVITACSNEELVAIVAHERGHLHSRDNLKRWLLACSPDALRWFPMHVEICDAWRDAAEDAADDAATLGREQSRVDLAALLLKVARLAEAAPAPVAVSLFADAGGLDRRVRRLLSTDAPESRASWPMLIPVLVTGGVAALVSTIGGPTLLHRIYDIVELTITLGR